MSRDSDIERDSDIKESEYFEAEDFIIIKYKKTSYTVARKNIITLINNILCEKRCKNAIFKNRCISNCSDRDLINFLTRIKKRIIKIINTTLHTDFNHHMIINAYDKAEKINFDKNEYIIVESYNPNLKFSKEIINFLNKSITAYKNAYNNELMDMNIEQLTKLFIFLLCLDINIFAKYQYGGSRKPRNKANRKTRKKI